MSKRMVRDWTDSEKISKISPEAERFFIRLIMKADDFGCYPGDTRILRAALFPLLIDDIKNRMVETWLTECYTEGLILKYSVKGKDYVHIIDFGQRMDRARKKYPGPDESDDSKGSPESAGKIPPTPAGSGLNTNTKENTKENTKTDISLVDKSPRPPDPDFLKFQMFILNNAPAVGKMEIPFTAEQFAEIKKKFTKEVIRDLILRMGNYKPLVKKNKSSYLTFLNWSKNGFSNTNKSSAPAPGSSAAAAATITEIKKSST